MASGNIVTVESGGSSGPGGSVDASGIAVLSLGSATVLNAAIDSNSILICTYTQNASSAQGILSFIYIDVGEAVVVSSEPNDSNAVCWIVVNP